MVTSPDEFKGGFLDAFTSQHVFQAGPLPYADLKDPQTLNKYAYVRDNPLRYVDPDGHENRRERAEWRGSITKLRKGHRSGGEQLHGSQIVRLKTIPM